MSKLSNISTPRCFLRGVLKKQVRQNIPLLSRENGNTEPQVQDLRLNIEGSSSALVCKKITDIKESYFFKTLNIINEKQ